MYKELVISLYDHLNKDIVISNEKVISAALLATKQNEFMKILRSIDNLEASIKDVKKTNHNKIKQLLNKYILNLYEGITYCTYTSSTEDKHSSITLYKEHEKNITAYKDFEKDEIYFSGSEGLEYLVENNKEIIKEILNIIEIFTYAINKNFDINRFNPSCYYTYTDDLFKIEFCLDHAAPLITISEEFYKNKVNIMKDIDQESILFLILEHYNDILERIPININELEQNEVFNTIINTDYSHTLNATNNIKLK